MEQIIDKVPLDLIKSELTEERRLRFTNKSNNEVYVIDGNECPNVMNEIGRLREIAFRFAGGGTGKSVDIDDFDLGPNAYKQLVVWDPEHEEILGGYRYLFGKDWKYDINGQPILATGHMFHFSDEFIEKYAPYTVELGRSFVTLEYQSSRMGSKGLFALDNLWDGLGALTVIEPSFHYCFGKFTMYPQFDRMSRDMILYFLHKHFEDKDGLVYPMNPLKLDHSDEELSKLFVEDDFQADYKILNGLVRQHGVNIPPLVNAYMRLSPTMRMFGTAINDEFGDVEETGILVTVADIWEEKKLRHIQSFLESYKK